MSYQGPDVSADVIGYLQSSYISWCCSVAGSVLILYDHSLTVSEEIRFIWGKKLNSVNLLFYSNRCFTFLWAVANLLNFVVTYTTEGCTAIDMVQQGLTFTLFVIWAAFSAVRVYAISGGILILSLLVAALSLVPVATNVYANAIENTYQMSVLPVLGIQCFIGDNVSQALNTKLAITTRVCVIVSDILVLVTTWTKTYTLKRQASRCGVQMPLVTMLLRDGTAYFLLALILNIINIVGWTTDSFVYAVADFTTPVSSIIVSRFLLNLRNAAYNMARRGEKQQLSPGSLTQVSDSTTQLSSVRFVSFISEMAGELATGFNGDPIEINEVDGVMAASQAETSGSPEQESGRWRSCSPASQNTRRDV